MTELQPALQISPRMWVAALAAALLLHVGCFAVAVEYFDTGDTEPEFGAPSIEVGLELLARRGEPIELPPGPDTEESAASAPVQAQRKQAEHTTLPQETPVISDDPERLVAPIQTPKPKDEEKVVPEVTTNSLTPAIASEAMAMPRSAILPAGERSVAPEQGWGESAQRVRASWQKELIAHLDRHKHYPGSQTLDGVEVTVNFVIDDTGHVLSSAIMRGSGEPSFDVAALAMLSRADPVPKPPPPVVQEGLTFTLPIVFRVKHEN